jgi:hypothetical protein
MQGMSRHYFVSEYIYPIEKLKEAFGPDEEVYVCVNAGCEMHAQMKPLSRFVYLAYFRDGFIYRQVTPNVINGAKLARS